MLGSVSFNVTIDVSIDDFNSSLEYSEYILDNPVKLHLQMYQAEYGNPYLHYDINSVK